MSNRIGEGSDQNLIQEESVGCLKPLLTIFLVIFMLGFGLAGLCSMLGNTQEDHLFVMVGFLGAIAMFILLRLLWRGKS